MHIVAVEVIQDQHIGVACGGGVEEATVLIHEDPASRREALDKYCIGFSTGACLSGRGIGIFGVSGGVHRTGWCWLRRADALAGLVKVPLYHVRRLRRVLADEVRREFWPRHEVHCIYRTTQHGQGRVAKGAVEERNTFCNCHVWYCVEGKGGGEED